MANSGHGIVRDDRGQDQPADKRRARTAHKTEPENSVSREATRDPKLGDAAKRPGSSMTRDDDAPRR
jgi:hypothetical protein